MYLQDLKNKNGKLSNIFRVHEETGFPGGTVVKNPLANAGGAGDVSSIPGLGRFPGGGNGNPLQYFCLENPMERGAWWAKVCPQGLKRVRHNWVSTVTTAQCLLKK